MGEVQYGADGIVLNTRITLRGWIYKLSIRFKYVARRHDAQICRITRILHTVDSNCVRGGTKFLPFYRFREMKY